MTETHRGTVHDSGLMRTTSLIGSFSDDVEMTVKMKAAEIKARTKQRDTCAISRCWRTRLFPVIAKLAKREGLSPTQADSRPVVGQKKTNRDYILTVPLAFAIHECVGRCGQFLYTMIGIAVQHQRQFCELLPTGDAHNDRDKPVILLGLLQDCDAVQRTCSLLPVDISEKNGFGT